MKTKNGNAVVLSFSPWQDLSVKFVSPVLANSEKLSPSLKEQSPSSERAEAIQRWS